jgi:two-component system sensor histidine kinase BarA
MSHEIRTPMNGMMVMAEMLAAAPLSPRHLRYAEIITRSGKNLLHIINDVLDFSKIESGRIELEEIEFSIDAVVEDVASLFAERAREKELSLAVYIAPNVPLRHIGDPVRLSQIVGNLVNNGLKFTQRGGVTISVELDRLESKRLLCIVEDTGIGIPKDQVDRIFSRFSQADSTITRKFGGTGLGLSISKQLAELMGGIVRVESSIGLGSRFIVSLPLLVAEEATPYWVAKDISAAVLDSDPVTRETVVRAFQDRGVSIADDFHKADMVILRAGDQIASSLAAAVAPIVLLRPFAATTAFPVTGRPADLELSMPVARKTFDRLLQSFEIGHLSHVDLETTSDAAPTVPDLKYLNILAVDDVAVNREVLGEALRAFNISCDLADSGPAAIERASNRAYDVIFMDCSMPGMDGFEATREIRRLERDAGRKAAFIVALTGHVMGKEADAWKQAGMDGYIAKPFNMHQLLETFRTCELVSGNEQQELRVSGQKVDALLSAETMEMFQSIKTSTGTDIRQKVFELFSASSVSSYQVAAAEIRSQGPDAKRLIHALKSNCSSSGALRATALCQKLELMIVEERVVDHALLDSLSVVLLETIEFMRTLTANASPNIAEGVISVDA